ncbi:MAG: LysE family transporter [Paracoccaceae bacterium]|nr:LysE family transporter [Paracoccaceae bacterium]
MTLTAFLALSTVQLMAAISPGPAVLMTARTGVTQGLRMGVWMAAGIGLGAVFWAVSALFGLALLFQVAPALLTVLKVAGGAYLLWIALQMWRHAPEPLAGAADQGGLPRSGPAALWKGITTQLANPKPVVFFGAVFAGMVPPETALWIKGALLGVVFTTDFLWNVFVARLFSFDRSRAAYLSLKTAIDRTFGGLLGVLGLKVALT